MGVKMRTEEIKKRMNTKLSRTKALSPVLNVKNVLSEQIRLSFFLHEIYLKTWSKVCP